MYKNKKKKKKKKTFFKKKNKKDDEHDYKSTLNKLSSLKSMKTKLNWKKFVDKSKVMRMFHGSKLQNKKRKK